LVTKPFAASFFTQGRRCMTAPMFSPLAGKRRS
jgi:hypothetical protein